MVKLGITLLQLERHFEMIDPHLSRIYDRCQLRLFVLLIDRNALLKYLSHLEGYHKPQVLMWIQIELMFASAEVLFVFLFPNTDEHRHWQTLEKRPACLQWRGEKQ